MIDSRGEKFTNRHHEGGVSLLESLIPLRFRAFLDKKGNLPVTDYISRDLSNLVTPGLEQSLNPYPLKV